MLRMLCAVAIAFTLLASATTAEAQNKVNKSTFKFKNTSKNQTYNDIHIKLTEKASSADGTAFKDYTVTGNEISGGGGGSVAPGDVDKVTIESKNKIRVKKDETYWTKDGVKQADSMKIYVFDPTGPNWDELSANSYQGTIRIRNLEDTPMHVTGLASWARPAADLLGPNWDSTVGARHLADLADQAIAVGDSVEIVVGACYGYEYILVTGQVSYDGEPGALAVASAGSPLDIPATTSTGLVVLAVLLAGAGALALVRRKRAVPTA
jgi:hypothetical protein